MGQSSKKSTLVKRMDDGLLDSIARRVIKIILTEKTVVHRYCLWTLQFPLFEPPPLSLLCCRGAVPKRRFARSGRLPVRPPSQSDEMLGISQVSRRAEKTRQRESIDLHARHTVTLSSLELGSRGFPVR